MKCGETIFVKNLHGSYEMRFIAQCEGRFMQITHNLDWRNGFMLSDWKGVLRELVAAAVPAKLIERTMNVESAGTGFFVGFPLTYPLSVKGLADLLGVPLDEVRAQLEDLAVQTDG